MGAKCEGINRHNWLVQNTQVDVKNSIGNEEVKEFICRTHGHQLSGGGGGLPKGIGGTTGWKAAKGEKLGQL